jgi:Cu+-exporting ATPase
MVTGAERRGGALTSTEAFESVTGKGVQGRIGRHRVALGNRALMEQLGVDLSALAEFRRTVAS